MYRDLPCPKRKRMRSWFWFCLLGTLITTSAALTAMRIVFLCPRSLVGSEVPGLFFVGPGAILAYPVFLLFGYSTSKITFVLGSFLQWQCVFWWGAGRIADGSAIPWIRLVMLYLVVCGLFLLFF